MPSPEHYRSLELEDAARSAVQRSSQVMGNFIKIGVPSAAALFVGWMVYASQHQETRPMTTPEKEEFHTTTFPAPSIEQRPNLDLGRMTAPPPPPASEVPPPPVAPPTPLVAPPAFETESEPKIDDAESRRLAAEEERRRWEHLRAPQLVADGAVGAAAAGNTERGGSGASEIADDDANRRFLARAGSAGVERSIATRNERIDALVPQGAMVRGELLTAIQSDLPGSVKAITREDVWSFDGRRVLIPSGSTLIGEYRSSLARGQTRVFVVWTRLLRPDGVSVQLGSQGTDDLGRAGNSGYLDNHYAERFGAAVALSVIGGVSQFVATLGQNVNSYQQQNQYVLDPVTGQLTAVTTLPNQNMINARQIGAQQVSQSLTRLSQEALRDSINIPPTVYIDQGARIVVFIKKDLDFSAFYPDPVKEELRELRREAKARR
jgi:type IV secretion system protein VirB10